MQNDLRQFEPVLDCLSSTETIGSDFLQNCELFVPNFVWDSSPSLHTLPGEKFASFSHHTKMAFESVNIKKEFAQNNCECDT